MENILSNSRPARGAIDKFALLRNHPLFRALRPPVIERLASYMEQRRIARGGVIFAKGDADTGLMGVLAGSVKISVASAKGRNIVLNIIHAGGVFGEMSLFDGHPRPTDATALSDCELLVIKHQDFMPFLRSEPDLGLQFIEILCARLRRTSEQVEDGTFLDLPTRLARMLLRLTAASAPTGTVAITQREISQIIGQSREGTNKQLRAWAKHGWIRLKRGGVSVLQPEKLAEVAAEDVCAQLIGAESQNLHRRCSD
jgi:CRP/FNR family transcriptional regulator, cyclic AMP receptor protein